MSRGAYPTAAWAADHRPRRVRAALLLAVAFAATVTAVIAGARLLGGGDSGSPNGLGLGPACPAGVQCATFFPPAASADPGASDPPPTDPPSGQPTGEPPTVVPSPRVGRTGGASPSPEARKNGDDANVTDVRAKVRNTPSPAPKVTAAEGEAKPKRAVVKYTVTDEANGQYAAEIAIGNEGRGDLRGWEIRLPISGRAFAVDGASAVQRGDTLVISSESLIPPGGGIAVAIAVRGVSVSPDSCDLKGGACRVL